MATMVEQAPVAPRTRQQELEALRDAQAARLRVQLHRLRTGETSDVVDIEERALSSEDRRIGCSLIAGAAQTIQDIEAALERLQVGEIVDCTECRRPISRARVRALPFARLCLTCQEAHDQAAATKAGREVGAQMSATRLRGAGGRPEVPAGMGDAGAGRQVRSPSSTSRDGGELHSGVRSRRALGSLPEGARSLPF